jgi:hypothetical protein
MLNIRKLPSRGAVHQTYSLIHRMNVMGQPKSLQEFLRFRLKLFRLLEVLGDALQNPSANQAPAPELL